MQSKPTGTRKLLMAEDSDIINLRESVSSNKMIKLQIRSSISQFYNWVTYIPSNGLCLTTCQCYTLNLPWVQVAYATSSKSQGMLESV